MNRRGLLAAASALCIGAFLIPEPSWAGAYDDWFVAAKLDDAVTVRSLLARGFDVNAPEEQRGDVALILAMREGSMQVFRTLMKDPGIDLERRNKVGDTALMIAALKGNLPAVQALVEKGAEVNRPGWTALHYAATSGHLEVTRFLLEHHAYVDAESPNGTTPLMMAAWQGHILVVKTLLEEGADASLRNAVGMDVIDFAEHGKHPDVVQGLRHRLGR